MRFSINQNKLMQTSGHGPEVKKVKERKARAELKGCLGHVIS